MIDSTRVKADASGDSADYRGFSVRRKLVGIALTGILFTLLVAAAGLYGHPQMGRAMRMDWPL